MDAQCAAALDNVLTFPKAMLVRRIGILHDGRRHELCSAMAAVMDC